MSTRANIIVEVTQAFKQEDNPNNGIRMAQYYHHMDGYIMGVGQELVECLKKLDGEETIPFNYIDSLHSFESFLKNNLPMSYEKENIKADKHDIANIAPCLHGDIEYVYVIRANAKMLELHAYKREDFENKIENWTTWKSVRLLQINNKTGFNYLSVDYIHLEEI